MGCACNKNKTQYDVVDSTGKRLWGPSTFETTANAMATRYASVGGKVRTLDAAGNPKAV